MTGSLWRVRVNGFVEVILEGLDSKGQAILKGLDGKSNDEDSGDSTVRARVRLFLRVLVVRVRVKLF